VAFGAICAVASADLARIVVQPHDAARALALAPLGADTRMDRLADLMTESPQLDTERIQAIARTGQQLHPADGRFDSVLGLLAHTAGDYDEARVQFQQAIAKQPTEYQALRHLLGYALSERDHATAATYAHRLALRWSDRWEADEPLVMAVLADPEGRSAMAGAFASGPEAPRRLLIGTLQRNQGGPLIAAEILMAWHENGSVDLNRYVAQVVRRLLSQGNVETALVLDRFTLGALQLPADGFVNNGGFQQMPSGSLFDWTVEQQQGVAFDWVGQDNASGNRNAAASDAYVRLQFLQAPLRLDNLSQRLVLRPGMHRLTVRARQDRFQGPQPLKVIVHCGNARRVIAEVPLDALDETWRDHSRDFAIDADTCPLQQISVSNGFLPLSWSNRYDGAVELDRIQIVRLP